MHETSTHGHVLESKYLPLVCEVYHYEAKVRQSLQCEQQQYWDGIAQRKGSLVKRQNGGAMETEEGDRNENVKVNVKR